MNQVDEELYLEPANSPFNRTLSWRECVGVTGFLLDLNFGGQVPQELMLRSMRLLSEKVMPAFK